MDDAKKDKTEKVKTAPIIRRAAIFDDDYVLDGEIAETPAYPRVLFKYKPLNNIQLATYSDAIMKGNTIVHVAGCSLEMCAKQLISWDVHDSKGVSVDCNDVKILEKINPSIMEKISAAIRGDESTSKKDLEVVKEEAKN